MMSAFLLALLLGIGSLIPGCIAIAQTKAAPPPEASLANAAKFEVASIKSYKQPPRGSVHFGVFAPPRSGRLSATGVTVRGLIQAAYGVEGAQIVGGPKWISSEQFDIQAEADNATDAELRKLSIDQAILVKKHMVQGLLAHRFGLKLHHETRDLPVYLLVVARHGPKLREVENRQLLPGKLEARTEPVARRPGSRMIRGGRKLLPHTQQWPKQRGTCQSSWVDGSSTERVSPGTIATHCIGR